MPPLFVSFVGNRAGTHSCGWAVLTYDGPVSNGAAIESISRELERARQYDAGTLVITNFRRLETV